MTKTAVIDIDNTLWPFCDPFYEELKKIDKAVPPVSEWTSGGFWEPYCSEQQFLAAIDAIHYAQDSEEYRPYPEARGFLRSLREQGYHIIIASHRRQDTRRQTERWLKKHGLLHDKLHLSFDKTVLFSRARVVVDDSPQVLRKAAASRVLSAGLLFPWNRDYAGNGIGLFRNLNEVLEYITREQEGIAGHHPGRIAEP